MLALRREDESITSLVLAALAAVPQSTVNEDLLMSEAFAGVVATQDSKTPEKASLVTSCL